MRFSCCGHEKGYARQFSISYDLPVWFMRSAYSVMLHMLLQPLWHVAPSAPREVRCENQPANLVRARGGAAGTVARETRGWPKLTRILRRPSPFRAAAGCHPKT